jgi:MFS family permease
MATFPRTTITITNTDLHTPTPLWDRTFGCFLLVFFLFNVALGVFPPILPQLMTDLDLSFATAGLLGTAFGLFRFVVDLPTGILVERLGIPLILHSAAGLLVLGTGLSALASSFWGMCLARACLGAGSGMAMVFAVLYLMRHGAAENRNRRANLYEMSVISGMAVSAEAGGLIASRWGWQWSFIAGLFILALAWIVVTWGVLPQIRSLLPASQTPSPFVATERQNPRGPLLVIFILVFGQAFAWGGGVSTLLPLYGGDKLFLSPEAIGRAMAIAFWVEVCLLFPVGWAADVWGKTTVVLPGFLAMLAGTLIAPFATGPGVYGFSFILLLSGMSVWMAAPGLLAEWSPGGFRGRSAGLYRLVTDFAFILAPGIVGWLVGQWGFTAGATLVAVVVAVPILLAGGYLRKLRPN